MWKKKNWVKIETERIKFRVAGLPSDDYPVIEEQPAGCAFEIETESFKDMIAKTIFAASAEDNRQAVSGILMELLENTTLRMVATDGHRLAMVKRKVDIQRSLSEVHCERQETTSSKTTFFNHYSPAGLGRIEADHRGKCWAGKRN